MMPENYGMTGLRPRDNSFAVEFTAPAYNVHNVLKYSEDLRQLLFSRRNVVHIHQRERSEGDKAAENACKALDSYVREGLLVRDEEPCYYVYGQFFNGEDRLGVILDLEVSPYKEGKVVRHEGFSRTGFKQKSRVSMATGFNGNTIFGVVEDSEGKLLALLEDVVASQEPVYSFSTDFNGVSDMDGIQNKVWRVPADSPMGQAFHDLVEKERVYIADGHNRYQCALTLGQKTIPTFVSPAASSKIHPYDRVVNGVPEKTLESLPELLSDKFESREVNGLGIPEKHSFIFYSKEKVLLFSPKQEFLNSLGNDPVKTLDVSVFNKHILEPVLGITREKARDKKFLYYFPGHETGFKKMKMLVDEGKYQLAVSMHPTYFSELKAIADKFVGREDQEIPKKWTYFWPKLLTGLFLSKIRKS
jgi:uncharacterized protein (DUF1015 family)